MISDRSLVRAVDEGVITPDQAERLRAIVGRLAATEPQDWMPAKLFTRRLRMALPSYPALGDSIDRIGSVVLLLNPSWRPLRAAILALLPVALARRLPNAACPVPS